MAATPTPSILSKVTGVNPADAPPLDLKQMANDELPKLPKSIVGGSLNQTDGIGAGFSFGLSLDGDAVLEGSGIKDGKVNLTRLTDGLSVHVTIRF